MCEENRNIDFTTYTVIFENNLIIHSNSIHDLDKKGTDSVLYELFVYTFDNDKRTEMDSLAIRFFEDEYTDIDAINEYMWDDWQEGSYVSIDFDFDTLFTQILDILGLENNDGNTQSLKNILNYMLTRSTNFEGYDF